MQELYVFINTLATALIFVQNTGIGMSFHFYPSFISLNGDTKTKAQNLGVRRIKCEL